MTITTAKRKGGEQFRVPETEQQKGRGRTETPQAASQTTRQRRLHPTARQAQRFTGNGDQWAHGLKNTGNSQYIKGVVLIQVQMRDNTPNGAQPTIPHGRPTRGTMTPTASLETPQERGGGLHRRHRHKTPTASQEWASPTTKEATRGHTQLRTTMGAQATTNKKKSANYAKHAYFSKRCVYL